MTTGSVLAQFTITLSQAVSEQVAVEWHTADGTALAGVDYAAAKGTVLFAPGQTAKTVDILVHGRAVGAEDRSFFVEMLPPTNAILGASIGECIIHVDTTGSTPVTQIIVPTGPQGDSAYQAWLDIGNTGTEEDFINSLKPSAEEIAEEVAKLLDVSNSPLTAEGTETLSKPDTMTGQRLARRVAYVGAAKVATVVLADGDNLITHADLSGDAVDFNSISLYPRILRGAVVISPEWSVESGDKILIKSAVAGDVLYVCQYDVISDQAAKNVLAPIGSQAFEALRRSYAEARYNVVGTFRGGFTIVNANDVGIDETTGKGFTGPVGPVAAGTNPASGGFVDVSEELLLSRLASDSGADLVLLKPSGVSASVKRALSEVVYDEIINVNWFGAVGDWNAATQTGADDNNAFQAALDYYATLGTKREGGKRAIEVPAGCFRISAVTARAAMGFGIDFKGAGKNATSIYADPSNPNPAITSEIEFVNFLDMTLFGALSETSNRADWKPVFFKGKLASNLADIDVRFSNCIVGYATSFAQIYGRGCIFDAGTTAVFCTNLLEIVADTSTVFTTGTNAVQTGMRHYCFYGVRTDVVSRLVSITGTGPQISHINGIHITGCDFLTMDRLIDSNTATIQRAVISGNMSKKSFAGGVVSVGGVIDCEDTGNSWCNEFDTTIVPTAIDQTIRAGWISQGVIRGLTLIGTSITGVREWVVRAAGASSNVKISACNFPEFGTVKGASSDTRLFEGLSSCDGLILTDNTTSTSAPSGTISLYNSAIQVGRTVCRGNIPSGQSFSDPRQSYNPNLLVGGVASATAPVARSGRIRDMSQTHVTVDFQLMITPVEVSGVLSISLPTFVAAIADSPGITAGYSGTGIIPVAEGFGNATSTMLPPRVNPTTQEIELWLGNNLSGTRLNASHRTGQIIIRGTVTYRYA